MRSFFYLVLCLLLTFSVAAQPTMDDTLKVPLLIRLGQQYENNNPDSAVFYYREAGSLSARLHYDAGVIQYIKNYTAVLNVQGKYDSSLALNKRALDIARAHGWPVEIMKSFANLGAVYQYKELYNQALDHYLQALSIAEKLPGHPFVGSIYGNMCGIYRNLNQPEKAEVYARKALKQAEAAHDLFATGDASSNLANALKDQGHITEAMTLLERVLKIGESIKNVTMVETALINMGDGYEKLRLPDKYMASFQAALPLAEKLDDVMGKAIILQGISEALFHQRRFREGLKAMQDALLYARAHQQKEVESHLLLLLSDTEMALGNLDAGESYRVQYDSVRSLLVNESLLKNIQELETKYAVEKSRRELVDKNLLLEEGRRTTERQRLMLIVAVLAVLLLGALLFARFRIQENIRLRSVLEGESRERRRISQEMHDDMGSGLTSLLFLSRTLPGGSGGAIGEEAEGLILKMNEIIWAMNDGQDSLDSLVAYIRINTAKMLDTAGLPFVFFVQEPVPGRSLGQEFRRNIYLVVKEAVHNVIRHAGATHVRVDVVFDQGLRIVVSDDGKGFSGDGSNRFGNGMKNMQRRMEAVGGSLSFRAEGGTTVVLSAPWPV